RDETAFDAFAELALEDLDEARTGTPGDVESRDRVAVPCSVVSAAFGPVDHREDLQPALLEPGVLLPRGELDIGLGPAPRPAVLDLAVEAGGPHPVLQGEFVGILDPESSLFGTVDEEQPTERPEGLPANVVRVLLIDQQNLATGVDQFTDRHEPRESRPHHDHVSVHGRQHYRADAATGSTGGPGGITPRDCSTDAAARRGRSVRHRGAVRGRRRRGSPAGVRTRRVAERRSPDAAIPRAAPSATRPSPSRGNATRPTPHRPRGRTPVPSSRCPSPDRGCRRGPPSSG